jgi:hypothetical protein
METQDENIMPTQPTAPVYAQLTLLVRIGFRGFAVWGGATGVAISKAFI